MASTNNSGFSNGTQGAPQITVEEQSYPTQVQEIEVSHNDEIPKKYAPSPKHKADYGWGSENPIESINEGQKLLDEGYTDGKQVYNVTKDGKIVKFQPDNTPENGYHSYNVFSPKDIPTSILRQMYNDGKISKSDYNKFLKGKKGKK